MVARRMTNMPNALRSGTGHVTEAIAERLGRRATDAPLESSQR